MVVSTKGRYALRVMLALAQAAREQQTTESYVPGPYVSLKEISEQQKISRKYLESIMTVLSKAGLVDGNRGKGGGYRLNRPPEAYPISEILSLTEGSLAPVNCLSDGQALCPNAAHCPTLPLWQELDALIADFFHRRTLADLMKNTADSGNASCKVRDGSSEG